MFPTVNDLHKRLTHLMPAHQADLVHVRWEQEVGEGASDARLFVHWLQHHGHVTRFQIKRLLRDRVGPLVLGPYQIVDRLGKGDMAKVYKARAADGSLVALKTLPPSRSHSPRWLKRFRREGRLMCRLDHPHLMRALKCGNHEGIHYLVMEFAEGESLEQVLRRRKTLPPLEAARVLYQALSGLQYLSENGLVHGNLKPANLLLVHGSGKKRKRTTAGSTLKILDIGLGPAVFKDRIRAIRAAMRNDGCGRLEHCADYLAPQMARDPYHYDIRADIYSLGCILYRCLTGQLPFPEPNGVAQIIHLQTGAPRPIKEFQPQIPELLQQFAEKMMARDPNDRFSGPNDALDAVAGYLLVAQKLVPLSFCRGHKILVSRSQKHSCAC